MRALMFSIALACAACGPGQTRPPAAALDEPATSASIIAAFTGAHPLARAQALEGEGRRADAEAAAREALAADPQLAGLCFERFTVGGAEIVLQPCAAMSAGKRERFVRERAQALSALPDVAYAEPNLIASSGA